LSNAFLQQKLKATLTKGFALRMDSAGAVGCCQHKCPYLMSLRRIVRQGHCCVDVNAARVDRMHAVQR
jgi:hypothetical protein